MLLGKPLAALAIVAAAAATRSRVALAVAVALAQIGEFSFILAALGRELGPARTRRRNALVAAAIVSITLNPLLYRLVDPADDWIARRPWLRRRARCARAPAAPARRRGPVAGGASPAHRAVVVGYGPVGRIVARLLREN